MSNMDNIIMELQGDVTDKNRWIDTWSGWNSFDFSISCSNTHILNKIKHALFVDGKRELRKATRITFVEGKPYRTEEFIERLLVVANSNLFNQFNIGSSKESIDLIYSENNPPSNVNTMSLIELKEWNSRDTPIYGIIELLKNYALLENDIKLKPSVKDLVLLAPKSYYKQFNDYRNFFYFLEKVRLEIVPVALQLYYLDISKEKLLEVFSNLNPRETIELKDYSNIIDSIPELKMNNWIKIKDITDLSNIET